MILLASAAQPVAALYVSTAESGTYIGQSLVFEKQPDPNVGGVVALTNTALSDVQPATNWSQYADIIYPLSEYE